MEYFLKTRLAPEQAEVGEWIHFALTSQDINNTAIPLLWKHAMETEYLPTLLNLKRQLEMLARDWKDIPMLARTHGQPASPTRLGKEIDGLCRRIGQPGRAADPDPVLRQVRWCYRKFQRPPRRVSRIGIGLRLANEFVEGTLGLQRCSTRHRSNITIISPPSSTPSARINTILIDFCRDIWTYVSMDYFSQKNKKRRDRFLRHAA